FNPGDTTKPITVVVNGDTVNEPNETFFVNLSSALNATIADGQGVGTILNDDGGVSFAPVTNYAVGASPVSVAVGDFNGDGKQDLAVANYNDNTVSILLNTGTGSFAAATNFSVGSFPRSVAIGDFNGDGKQDLAVANESSNNVSILLGTGTGSFA